MLASNLQKKIFKLLSGAFVVLALVIYFVQFAQIAFAQANPQINYQGKLTNSLGVAVPDGTYNMNFWLVASGTAATSTAVWSEALTGVNRVQVTNGLFSVMLGSTTALTGVDFNQTLFLGVEIGGTSTPAWDGEMSPRKILGTVPAAFVANYAATAGVASSSDSSALLGGVASSSFLRSDQADTMEATSTSPLLTMIQNGAGAIARFFSGVTEVFTILNNGNVGVGTSNPQSQLHLKNTASTTIALESSDTATGTITGILKFQTNTNDYQWAGISGVRTSQFSDRNALAFYTTPGSSAPALERMRLDSTGKLGIGTTTPTSQLTVVGDTYITGVFRDGTNSAGTNGMVLRTSGSGTTWVATSTLGLSSSFTNSNELATLLSDETGTAGGFARSTSPVFITPTLGVAQATSINVSNIASFTGTVSANDIFTIPSTGAGSYLAYSPVSKALWHDRLAFSKSWGEPIFETYNGSWATSTLDAGLFSQQEDRAIQQIDGVTNTSARWTWNSSNAQYSNPDWWLIGVTWTPAASSKDFLIESSADGSVWTTRHTSTGNTANANPVMLKMTSNSSDSYIRLTITVTNGQPLKLSSIRALSSRWGNQGGGSEQEYPYLWDENQRIAFGSSTAVANGLVTIGSNTTDAANGLYFGTDTNLYRSGANQLMTDNGLSVTGNVGIGTTTPSSKLTVAGDFYATGAFRDSSNASGTQGMVLQTTGSGTQWVATSSLGFASSFSNSAQLAALLSDETGTGFAVFSDTPVFTTNITTPIVTSSGSLVVDSGTSNTLGFGTGANAKTITLGNVTGATAMNFNTGTGGTTYTTTNGIFSLNTGTGTINIGTDATAKTINIGNSTGATAINLNTGTGSSLNLGTNAVAHTVTIGNSTGATAVTINTGTGNSLNLGTNAIAKTITIGNVTGTTGIRFNAGTGATAFLTSNVAVGTTTPSAKLSIQNGFGSTTPLFDIATTTSASFATSSLFRVNHDGNVGIGTTTPGSLLTVAGNTFIGGTLSTLGATILNSTLNVTGNTILTNASTTNFTLSGRFYDGANSSGTNGMVLQTTGSGTQWVATSSLGFTSGTTTFLGLTDTPSSYTANRLLFTNSGGTALTDSSSLVFDGTNLGIGSTTPSATLALTGSGSTNPFLIASSSGSSLFAVLANGNVGIGTTTPENKLTVAGDTYVGGTLTVKGNAGTSNTFNIASSSGASTLAMLADGSMELPGQLISAGINWTGRSVAGNNDGWNSIAYGNGLFVSVSESGDRVMTSPDGIVWATSTATGDDDGWNSVTYGNGLFVAVGYSGDPVMTSSDGITWTARTASEANSWQSVTYGNNLFVAVSSDGTNRVMTSPDGINWTARSAAGNDDEWVGVTYGNGLFVAVGYSGDRVMTSPDGITWTARSAAGNDDIWQAITYGNGLFVAVGTSVGDDLVMTSPDGINWTARSVAGNDDQWKSVTYGNGLFIAISVGGDRVITSPDGITWTTRSAAGDNDNWRSVTYGNGLFVAVGWGGNDHVVMTSGFTSENRLTHNNIYQGGTSFLGGLRAGTTSTSVAASIFLQSEAGKNPFTIASSTGTQLFSILQNGNVGVGVGTPAARFDLVSAFSETVADNRYVIRSSTNNTGVVTSGVDRTYGNYIEVNRSGATGGTIQTYGNYISVGGDNAGSGTSNVYGSYIYYAFGGPTPDNGYGLYIDNVNATNDYAIYQTSSDDSNYFAGNVGIGTTTPSSKLTVVGDFYATGAFRDSSNASGTIGMILQTTGTSTRWVATSSLGLGNNTFLGLTDTPSSYTANRMLFVNSTGNAVTSSSSIAFDGTDLYLSGQVVSAGNVWTSRATTTSTWQSVTYGNGLFVAVGNAGAVYTSPDGINWTTRTAAEANNWKSVTYGNGLFVAVSTSGTNRVMTSPNGINWTAYAATESSIWRSVTYGNGLFVAVSYDGTNRVMTSPDGFIWTARTSVSATWTSVTYGNGLFVAVSYNGANQVMTSPDGVTWTARTAAATNNWQSVTYGNGLFVAVSDSGANRGMTSPDGINWTSRYITPNAYSSVTYGNGLFVTVGQSGITGPSMSTDGINWTSVYIPEYNLWNGVAYGNGMFVAVSSNGTNRVMTTGKTYTNQLATGNIYQGGTSFLGGLRAGTTSASVGSSIFLQSEAGKNPFAIASSSGAELLSLSQSGALGIGTSSPLARYLDVGPVGGFSVIAPFNPYVAGIHQQSAVAADDTLMLTNSGGLSRTASIQFRTSSSIQTGAFSTARIVAGAGTGYSSSFLTLGSSNGNNSFNSELTLKNGLVGIGTSTPSATLTIAGSGSNNPFNISSSTGASLLALTQTGALGLGTSSPYALGLTMERTGISGTTTAGIGQYLTFANSVASAQQFVNDTYIKTTNSATTTLVGSIIRLEDNTALGNTVRGFEVQTERGNNTLGENTAISGFARTFGVRGVTEGDAGGTYEPAGIYGETRGTTQSNAIRGYSSTITTSALLKLFQDTSAFTGTGLLMNFGNSGGTFSSTTASHFIDLKNAGTSRFKVGAYGMLTIGDGSTTTNAGIQIGYGGLCVDTDGSCNASTTGRISSVSNSTGNSDLAEMYFSDEDLLPGEIVYLKGGLSVGRATTSTRSRILGVVSTLPGVIMGENDTSLVAGEIAHPIALKGRVPVRLSNENGDIKAGDDLMLSSIPGVAMKASSTGKVIGTALEDFVSSRAYSDTYINQFGESIVVPVYTPISRINDPRVNDGCYFGGGNASGEEICVPLTATTTEAQYDEADEIAAREAKEAALRAMRRASSEEMNIGEGKTVQVGQIVMFVDLKYRYLDEAGEEMIAALLSKASTTENNSTTETIWQRLVNLANNFIDGVLRVFTLKADRVETSQLCVDGVCVNASDLRNLLEASNNSVQVIEIVEVISDQNIVDDTGTTTATSTDDTTEETTDETGEEELEEVEEVEAEAGPGSEIIPGPEPEPIPEPEVEIAPEPEISPPVTANTT